MIPEIPDQGLTLILGGARSGKSFFAEETAREAGGPVYFVATATAGDNEMARRIRNHQASRPAHWQTLEIPLEVGRSLLVDERLPRQGKAEPGATAVPVLIVDCITLLVTNILMSLPENAEFDIAMEKVMREIEVLIQARLEIGGQWLLVSNEVGLGLVPAYPLGRVFRDALGWANQRLARSADRVIFMVAGIPTLIK